MNKFVFLLSILLLAVPSMAQIERHEGFPVQTSYGLRALIVTADLEGDGKLEIIAAPENRMLKVFNHTGEMRWENVSGVNMYDYGRVPLLANLTGDERLEVVSYGNPGYSDATFYIWDAAGFRLREMPVGRCMLLTSPSISDDGMILTGAAMGKCKTVTQVAGVHAFDYTGNRWYLELGRNVSLFAAITLGELDGDGAREAVVLTQDIGSAYPTDGKVWAVKVNSSGGSISWSRSLGGDARNAAVADVNGDGMNEVVAVSSGGVYIFDRNGNEIYKFNIISNHAPPATGDLEGDGVNEVLIASNYDKMIYIISNGSLRGFSSGERVVSNLALGDLNGDGKLEISAGDMYGNMYVWDHLGNILEQRNTGTSEYFTSAAIVDLEGDGNKEIILGNYDGNIHVYTYRIKPKDTTPPVTADDVDGLWHNSNVTVTLTTVDPESGVAATYYTVDGSNPTTGSAQGTVINLTGEGVYTIRYFSVDNEGNVEGVKSATNQVRIDKTAPEISGAAAALPNAKGWYGSDVTIRFNATDALSGIDTVTPDAILSGEGVSQSTTGIAVDRAGNSANVTVAGVNIDKTLPATEISLEGTAGSSNWYVSNVSVALNATDAISGAAATYYRIDRGNYQTGTSFTIAGEGRHNISYYTVDNADNIETERELGINIDWTPPYTRDDVGGAWHNSNVTVNLTATDNLAGLNSTYYRITSGAVTWFESLFFWLAGTLGLAGSVTSQGGAVDITDEGIFEIHYYSTDNAGNMETESVSGQVRIDRTLPVITVSVPESRTYLHSDIITLSFTAQDALSGIGSMTSTIDGNRTVSDGQVLDMLELGFGAHEFYSGAQDRAGNLNSQRVGFSVIATIDSLIALNNRATTYGWITNSSNANSLASKLDSAKKSMDSGQNATAKNVLEAYINEIEAQTGNSITPEGAGILTAEARYVIDSLLDVNRMKAKGAGSQDKK